mgnify:CR=1 FL=1
MKNLNADLKNGTFLQVYLLTGEEAYLKNRYKKRLRAAIVGEDDLMNFTAYTGKGIDIRQVIETAETMPFFAERRLIQIEDSGFFKNACPELAEYLPTMPKETYMVFVEQEIDKRVFIRQMRPVDDQADHDLSRAMSATQIDVTYKTGP